MRVFRTVMAAALAVLFVAGVAGATNVTFQVNMTFAETTFGFDSTAPDSVVVRGDLNGWAGNAYALADTNGDGVYVGTFDITRSSYPDTSGFKFVIHDTSGADVWENDISNRELIIPDDTNPVVLDTVWFDDQEPVATTNVEVYFQVDMSVQELLGNFDPTVDIVVVRGNQPAIGNWGGETLLTKDLVTGFYSAWIQFNDLVPGEVQYKYVYITGGSGGTDNWESRDNRTFTVTGTETDTDANGYGEISLDVVYYDDSDASNYLTSPKDITFNVDARPAYYKLADPDSAIVDVQSGDIVTSIDAVNVAGYFNGWPWGSFTVPEQTLTDTDGDSIFTTTITFPEGTARDFIYKYGLNGYDVEAGFAQNHEVMLTDDGVAIAISDTFGIQGTLYTPYIDMLVSVREIPNAGLPNVFSLKQNYPNPFNPTTTIGFSLPQAGKTTLRVFNVMGQQVAKMDLGQLKAGVFEVTVDGSQLSSGVYFYRLNSGQFSATKKMMLLK